jgi:CBS domain-containing protein
MHRPVHVLRPDEDHATAAVVMHEKRIKRIPIAQNGKLLGIVSLSDLALIASVEAAQLRASLSFFTAVVRTQASQREPPGGAISAHRSVPLAEELLNNDQGRHDAGGPG